MNPFFNAQFNYYPFMWMLHSRYNNNKIKHLHDRCIRLTITITNFLNGDIRYEKLASEAITFCCLGVSHFQCSLKNPMFSKVQKIFFIVFNTTQKL